MLNKKVLFNDGWSFAKSPLHVEDPSHLTFESIDLPHDWLIYNTLDLYENSIGWYRKTFAYDKKDHQQIFVCFDGVYMDSSVYVNGQFVGEWKYGYSSFEHNITDAVTSGNNVILVKVVYKSPNSRWYSGAGIYRNVWLKTRDENHISTDGIYITTKQADHGWEVEIDTELAVQGGLVLSHSLMYEGDEIATTSNIIHPNKTHTVHDRQHVFIKNPQLWHTDEPNVYRLISRLQRRIPGNGNQPILQDIEEQTHPVGFRTVTLDPNEGFFLNGQHMKLKGVCEHHDLGALGAAFNKVALKRRLNILKEMGVNAIRTAHNMPAKELMDLADEMGILIISEAFDMWERPKTTYDYARFFKTWAKRDVKSWVMRDRNHPSLLMWSIGNEIYDTHADESGIETTEMLIGYVQTYDPKANSIITFGSNYLPWENTQKCADLLKVVGYNYAEKYYEQHHETYPDWVIYGSETSAVVQSRGVYRFPYEQSILADDDEQCSSLGNSATSWGAKSVQDCIVIDRDIPFSLGQFLWTGFDYIGEPTPYHTKNSYFGQIDTATFKKDSYYMYQAAWTDYKKAPMVHIFPYWDFNEGQIIDVQVCSNAPKVELQLNGVTLGTQQIDHKNGRNIIGTWKVPYESGELKAVAYDHTGDIIATDINRSFKDAHMLALNVDKNEMVADGTDLIFLTITTLDQDGHIVENANNRVTVDVTGSGRLLGLDNGDSTDDDQYKGKSRRLFSGKLMAIIGSVKEAGPIRVTVSSPDLGTRELELKSIKQDEHALIGVSAQTENKDEPLNVGKQGEIPLRKIEIISDSGQMLSPNNKEITVKSVLHPANTSYSDVEWRVVQNGGIESNLAEVDADGHEARITALGDGHFRIRCSSKNGTEKTKLISELDLTAQGLGQAYKDPYGFISGGLYDDSKGDLGNGNERGIATSRDGESQVCFRNIDFGPFGSDEITIPIFALSDEAYTLQIWEGMPDEPDSECLADVIYQKQSIWNTYQPETYILSRKLTGVTSLCFVLKNKVHIKGFSFKKINRAFEQTLAVDSDHIYGDTFKRTEAHVEGIGNNVSLEFKNFDFTDEGATKLAIRGRSPIDINTIHVRFVNKAGESHRHIVEFTHTDGYEEKIFDLDKVTDVQDVTFIFLPGCQFDFDWFQFKK